MLPQGTPRTRARQLSATRLPPSSARYFPARACQDYESVTFYLIIFYVENAYKRGYTKRRKYYVLHWCRSWYISRKASSYGR